MKSSEPSWVTPLRESVAGASRPGVEVARGSPPGLLAADTSYALTSALFTALVIAATRFRAQVGQAELDLIAVLLRTASVAFAVRTAFAIGALVQFHRAHGAQATITSVSPPGRFGALRLEDDRVTGFREKPVGDGGRINGGFFVAHPSVLDLIGGPDVPWEAEPLERLAGSGELRAFQHDGFWQPMDTLRDKHYLEELWNSGSAPWKVW